MPAGQLQPSWALAKAGEILYSQATRRTDEHFLQPRFFLGNHAAWHVELEQQGVLYPEHELPDVFRFSPSALIPHPLSVAQAPSQTPPTVPSRGRSLEVTLFPHPSSYCLLYCAHFSLYYSTVKWGGVVDLLPGQLGRAYQPF